MEHADVLIVGTGHAGAQAAIALRQRGYTGSVALVGEEADLPYERPPLSKDYLSGDKTFERILIRPPDFWIERDIRIMPGRKVTAIDATAHRAVFADATSIAYGRLIWAAGGHPRRLGCAGHDLAGVHAVRNRADVDRMVRELPSTTRVTVVGGGYIGLEAAAVLAKLGKTVTVVEAQDRVLARVAGLSLARFYEAQHRAHGVDVRLAAMVDRIEGNGGRASGVRLADGTVVAAEMVVVGIGITPAVEPLLAAGTAGGDGVDINEYCRTSLPDIYAIGDCARHANAFADGAWLRLESVQNAHDMAVAAAGHIVGDPQPYRATPWFWSNQYDLKLQTIGLSLGHDDAVVRGDPATRSFSIVYLKRGRVVALDCVNTVRDYVQGKTLVERGARIAPADLTDATRPLKTLMS